MTGLTTALTELINLLGSGIVSLSQKIAEGANQMVTNAFLTVDSTSGAVTGLSAFGGVVAIFGGVALAIGFTTLIFNWIRSLGSN